MIMNDLFVCFCRSDTSRSELAELSKQANPDEIDIDDDDDNEADDADQEPEGKGPTQLTLTCCRHVSFQIMSEVILPS